MLCQNNKLYNCSQWIFDFTLSHIYIEIKIYRLQWIQVFVSQYKYKFVGWINEIRIVIKKGGILENVYYIL